MMISRCVLAATLFVCAAAFAAAQPPTSSDPSLPARPAPPNMLRPGKAPKPAPPPPVLSPLDPKLDAKAALDIAKKQAEAKGGRVVIFWAADPEAQSTQAFVEATRAEDIRKLLGIDFAVVWAEIGASEHAAQNRDLAKTLGADVKATDKDATITVLEASGKPLSSRSASTMLDDIRKGMYSMLKIEDYLIPLKAPTPEAKVLMDAAVGRAKPSKGVLLVFGEFGNPWTNKFRAWLTQPEVERALASSTVVAHVELLRDKGAFELLESQGGIRIQTLPWYSMLDSTGKVVATSQTEKTPNIGFPTDDGEIAGFLDLLRKGSPALSEADSKVLRDSLVAHRERKAP